MHRIVEKPIMENKTVIMPQPIYSPDLVPADFFLFPKQKTPMKEKRFATIEQIKKIETKAVGDTKKHISEVSRGLKKKLS